MRGLRGAAAVPFVLLGAAAPVSGQGSGPPAPLPVRELALPGLHERTLAGGATLLVVPQREVPFVTVNVVLPGGSAADPEGKEGTATFVAQLLDRGTPTRTFEGIAGQLDHRGISLAAEASEEWSTVSLNATTPALEAGLEILADVLLNPIFPETEVERARTQALAGLRARSARPDLVAEQAFTRGLFGGHPYGRAPSSGSVEALTRDDLVDYHRTWYRPGDALVVVAGDVDPDRIAERLDEALRDWEPGPLPELAFARAPDRTRPEIRIVHVPGAVQAEIRVGHLLPGSGTAGWEDVVVANQLLGGGPPGRLQRVLRDARGLTYDARSEVRRMRRLGVFEVTTAVRNEVAATAVEEILAQAERLRTRALPEAELDDTRSYLVGSFPITLETPQQVAGRVATDRLLGLPADALERWRPRIAAVDTASVRRAAERWLRPDQFLVVLAGDAAVLQPQFRAFGDVRIVDGEGRPLTLAELPVRDREGSFDLSGLTPARLTYEVRVAGAVRGSAVRTLDAVDEGWRFASVIEAGPQRLEQEVVVDDALDLVSSRSRATSAGRETRVEVRREGGRLTGSLDVAGETRALDVPVPEGVTLSDGLELALWASDLEEGQVIRLPVANVQTGRIAEVRLEVGEAVEVTVPAGTFLAWRVSVSGVEAQTFHVRVDAPHIPIRMESATQPVALELVDTGGH